MATGKSRSRKLTCDLLAHFQALQNSCKLRPFGFCGICKFGLTDANTSKQIVRTCQKHTYVKQNARCWLASCISSGRGDRIWTCDLLVPNQTRYQTALHLDLWSQRRDSNPWPAVYETAALPTEPRWHHSQRIMIISQQGWICLYKTHNLTMLFPMYQLPK